AFPPSCLPRPRRDRAHRRCPEAAGDRGRPAPDRGVAGALGSRPPLV
ncbi:MAG: hypothetical protein AVDCRST_MAG20-901, partial [uncultured Acidimicrobiales bacterium]